MALEATEKDISIAFEKLAITSNGQTLYIGNLSDYTTEDDLYELFGLRSTKYLKQNCSVKMSTNSNTGKKKYFVMSLHLST